MLPRRLVEFGITVVFIVAAIFQVLALGAESLQYGEDCRAYWQQQPANRTARGRKGRLKQVAMFGEVGQDEPMLVRRGGGRPKCGRIRSISDNSRRSGSLGSSCGQSRARGVSYGSARLSGIINP